jgi:hypothetical protein
MAIPIRGSELPVFISTLKIHHTLAVEISP